MWEVYVNGKQVDTKTPRKAMNAGIGLITEDRRGNGILGCLSIKDNTGISMYTYNLGNKCYNLVVLRGTARMDM